MFDIMNLMWIVPFCLGLGFIFAEVRESWNRKNGEIKQVRKDPDEKKPLPEVKTDEEEKPDPMALRNDFGVYRGEKPTFAEQWVNIMNYNGENQKEEDYGEGED